VIADVASKLKHRRSDLMAAYGYAGVQTRVLGALDELAYQWKDPRYPVRIRAESAPGRWPYSMVKVSLQGLLASFSADSVQKLIRSEPFEASRSPELVGHVLADNTPLLGWVTVARALLVGSASLVKMPTTADAQWLDYFVATLGDIAPEIAGLVDSLAWRGGTASLDSELCRVCDRVAVYGDDSTVDAIIRHARSGSVVGYGHRVSGGIVMSTADPQTAAEGFAKDVLLYDQGGCLSPHTIFVEGDERDARSFGERLATALAASEYSRIPMPPNGVRAGKVREARDMARLEEGATIISDPSMRWTVIVLPKSMFRLSPTHGIVYVTPITQELLAGSLSPVAGKLQGFGLAGSKGSRQANLYAQLTEFGVSYICKPGLMQAPPLEWRENGLDVLRSLIM
jgi:hypothetical protein